MTEFKLVIGTFRNKQTHKDVEAVLVTRRTYDLARQWSNYSVDVRIGEMIVKNRDGSFTVVNNEPFLSEHDQLTVGEKAA